ncbi:hypothetical protein [Metabacillus sp. FJAT-52054]|uniref:Uncharacterized protein n=1 Tax=Metabacillus sediminis TaxID=3117746 RepID=A0ABZ2NIB1_9BACI
MYLEGIVIPGTKGRYGRAKISIRVMCLGFNGFRNVYKAFAFSKHGMVSETGSTPVQAIKKAEKKAVLHHNLIIEERKQKSKQFKRK